MQRIHPHTVLILFLILILILYLRAQSQPKVEKLTVTRHDTTLSLHLYKSWQLPCICIVGVKAWLVDSLVFRGIPAHREADPLFRTVNSDVFWGCSEFDAGTLQSPNLGSNTDPVRFVLLSR
ncbi:hypothetical protein EDB82DRAFT_106259 [Fusarium venenatum]|uniref:uncharacterized protein n=1 Tax=Fusarium venenatum TaxID=56646 RepID=UPI001D652E59|nr:hypothetical protein EDB82DRAFT_106259 [Fusarium venenatum]